MGNMGLKTAIFNKNAIQNGHFSQPITHEYGHILSSKKWYSTQKKRLFHMAYFKFHEKNY